MVLLKTLFVALKKKAYKRVVKKRIIFQSRIFFVYACWSAFSLFLVITPELVEHLNSCLFHSPFPCPSGFTVSVSTGPGSVWLRCHYCLFRGETLFIRLNGEKRDVLNAVERRSTTEANIN